MRQSRAHKQRRNKKAIGAVKSKKISRSYRISQTTDSIVKLASKIMKISEANLIERCIADRTTEFVHRHIWLENIVKADIPKELADLIHQSRDELFEKWTKEKGRLGSKKASR